jgi:hypothetical protein
VERLTWLLLVAALAAAAWIVAHTRPRANVEAARDFDLVSVVPQGPELLVSADVQALGAAAARDLLRASGGALLGLRELCGFEPLLSLRRVVLALPRGEADKSPDFALIAQTSLEPEPVLRCAEAVIRKRGGNPVRSSLGKFSSVRDQSKPLGEVAIRADGLFVLSGGQYFRDVIDAASGAQHADEPAKLRSAVHAGIRRKLGPSQLVVTLLVGPHLPLPGVQALGLGLDVQSEIRLRGFVGCTSATGCVEASSLLERLQQDLASDPNLSSLSQIKVEQRDAQLQIAGQLPREQLAPLLAQLLAP